MLTKEEQKKDRTAYLAAWYLANKDKIKARPSSQPEFKKQRNAARYLKNREAKLTWQKDYYQDNKESVGKYQVVYRSEHQEERKQYDKNYGMKNLPKKKRPKA